MAVVTTKTTMMAQSAKFVLGCVGLATTVQAQNWLWVAPTNNALSRDSPPDSFNRSENIISPVGVSSSLDDRPARLHSNKFYSNFLIEGPARSAWTLPYIVTVNDETPFGMYVSFPRFFEGQSQSDGRLKWYATSTTKDVIMSAKEVVLSQEALMTGFDDPGLSMAVEFTSEDEPQGRMSTHLVRGMAYATMMYENYTPEISTIHAILTVNGMRATAMNHTDPNGRFLIELNNGDTWILYSSEPEVEFFYVPAQPNEPNKLQANVTMDGTLRVTRIPYDSEHADYDQALELLDQYSGSYPVECRAQAKIRTANYNDGWWRLRWTVEGDTSVGLLHYALPHHQDMLNSQFRTGVFMASPTKGDMELVTGTSWTFRDRDMPDYDWIPSVSSITSDLEMEWIEYHLERELNVPLNNYAGASVYFGAKNLMAYAQLCLVADEIGRDDLVEGCVDQIESGFAEYVEGRNGNPLVYDTTWGGIIGSEGLKEGGVGADFFASLYNDHHFHYGYLVHVAATLARLRPSWATAEMKAWIESIIRDVNTPSYADPYFPANRYFDWFCGHSWARGLLFSYDGKDQESTSEDVNFYYAMTMYAMAVGNARLEGLGRIQLNIVRKSVQRYFLLKDDNDVHPPEFVRNKVTGVFFESKVDYTTWFGDNVEFIHGIQNIPVTAVTELVRDPEFVRQEWDQRLAEVVDGANGVWKTLLYMSYATVQRHMAFTEILSSGVDDGLHRTWALYWSATRPDCTIYCNHDEVTLDEVPAPTPAPVTPTGPFGGVPLPIPGKVEAEAFDYGGEGVGYSDSDPGNNGGQFRGDEGVDIQVVNGDEYYVGWTQPGEWLRYTVDVVEAAAAYDFVVSVASPFDFVGSFRIVSGGNDCTDYTSDLSGLVEVPSTGSWRTFIDMSITAGGTGGLSEGETSLFLCVESSGFNIHAFTMFAR